MGLEEQLLLAACTGIYLYTVYLGLKGDKRVKLYGPITVVRCERCARVMDAFTRLRIRGLGYVAVGVWMLLMAVGSALLLQNAVAALQLPPELAPTPNMLIGLPVVNPLIPLWYGAVGLAVAIAVHEFAHGITLRSNRLPVKSSGLIFLLVPLGAFVEPGEDLEKAARAQRVKVYSAGPFANILAMLIAIALFSALLQPVALKTGGVGITSILPGSPAEGAGLKPGDVITAVDGEPVRNLNEFLRAMAEKRAGEEVYLALEGGRVVKVTLADKYLFTKDPKDRGLGFIGVGLLDVGLVDSLIAPFSRPASSPAQLLINLLVLPLALPVSVLPYLELFYQPLGGWGLAYTLIWVAWMNMAVGLTNALPIVPFDGGNSLKVLLEWALQGIPEKKRAKIINYCMVIVSAVSVALLLAPVILPRIRF